MNSSDFQSLVKNLARLSQENEFECKCNKANPQEIGEYISALSNGAALLGRREAYILWGVEDSDYSIVGTNFRPRTTKVKGQ